MPPITDYGHIIDNLLPPFDSHWTRRDIVDIGEDAFLYDEQDKLVLKELINSITASFRPIKTMEVKKLVEFLLLAKEKWKMIKELNPKGHIDFLEFRHEFMNWFFLEHFFRDPAEHLITYLKLNKEDLLDRNFMDLIRFAYPVQPLDERFDLGTLFVFLKDVPLNPTGQEYLLLSRQISKSIIP